MNIKIYHNPRCKKSRDSYNLLKENAILFETIEYLKCPPSKKELKSILNKLNITAEELVRKSEGIFKEKYKGKKMSEEEWIEAMEKYPKLIQRPIIIKDNKAVVGRPIERVTSLLSI